MKHAWRSSAGIALAIAVACASCGAAAAARAAAHPLPQQGLDQRACPMVPPVPGVDQSPSKPEQYGKCTSEVDPRARGSNWCTFNDLGYWPAGPSPEAKQCMKFGRMTVYRGPVHGSEPGHKGACNADLAGSNETAMVAVSTKYLKTAQHGWTEDHGVCGKCMCIHMRGVDHKYNPGVKFYSARKHFGLTFLAKVGDRCGECEDEHIDVLLDRPLSYAPYDPASPQENVNAVHANSRPGPRGFGNPWAMRGGDASPETVGTWVADWQWVPCEGWSHAKCSEMMKGVGYVQTFPPNDTVGVDSVSLRRVDQPIGPEPWTNIEQGSAAVPKPVPTPTVAAQAMCGGMGEGCKAVKTNQQCQDVQWAHCPPGLECVRDSKWYWSCSERRAAPAPRPAAPEGAKPAVDEAEQQAPEGAEPAFKGAVQQDPEEAEPVTNDEDGPAS